MYVWVTVVVIICVNVSSPLKKNVGQPLQCLQPFLVYAPAYYAFVVAVA